MYKLSVQLSVTFFSEQSVGMTLVQRYDCSGTPLGQGRALPQRICRASPVPPRLDGMAIARGYRMPGTEQDIALFLALGCAADFWVLAS